MELRIVNNKKFIFLFLLAGEQEDMIDKYIEIETLKKILIEQ